jgi:hypothetical protein
VSVAVPSGDLIGRDDGWDVVLAGDISYQRDMAEPATDAGAPRRPRRRCLDRRSRPRLWPAIASNASPNIRARHACAGGRGHQTLGGLSVPREEVVDGRVLRGDVKRTFAAGREPAPRPTGLISRTKCREPDKFASLALTARPVPAEQSSFEIN